VKKDDAKRATIALARATGNRKSSPWLHLFKIKGLNRRRSLFVAFGNLFRGGRLLRCGKLVASKPRGTYVPAPGLAPRPCRILLQLLQAP